ncbi:uncharacterized protein [Temnothorax nylanderi]|uniref:uncharacterized protein n=1 Tax=Temnothorax nylanderi TaxID=102681 RepID=UPI003A86156F
MFRHYSCMKNVVCRYNYNNYVLQETFFYLLGGDSPQDQIKHSLEKMFSNKLAMKCSWKGQKGNFAISLLLIIDIIKNKTFYAARKHYPILTDRQNYVSAWLKYAKTRYDREQAKAQAVRNHADGPI